MSVLNKFMPVGAILAYLPGFFTNGDNAGYTPAGLTLPENWRVCDGSAVNDVASPIFNGADRYLPNLTDSRFIMGSTIAAVGTIGGNVNNEVALSIANLAAHTHTNAHTHTFSGSTSSAGDHSHTVPKSSGDGGAGFALRLNQNLNGTNNTGTDGAHIHTFSGTTSTASASTGSNGSGTAFSILPKYLTAAYIMRIK